MNKLVLTDFRLPERKIAYERMQKNLAALKHYGVITDGELPYTDVSAWDVVKHFQINVRNPAAICPEKKLQLLVWGSPSPNSSDNGPRPRESEEKEHIAYETMAFESMAWLCPIGVVAMPFSAKSCPVFYQPCSDRAAANRILVCCRMYSRAYVPMSTSSADTSIHEIMIALLVPPRFLTCLAYQGERLDYGNTIRNVLDMLGDDEYGCALGVCDLALEMELAFDRTDRKAST